MTSGERLYTTEAIIVRRRDQGEADRVLTLCTPQGKRVVIAKGARKPSSRKAGAPGTLCPGPDGCGPQHDFLGRGQPGGGAGASCALRGDLVRGTYARYVTELYDRFVAEDEGGPALFDLLSRTLDYLGQIEVGESVPPALDLLVRAYEQRLLALVGFRPEWGRCMGEKEGRLCGRPLPAKGRSPLGLDPERGGALCAECFQDSVAHPWVVHLSPAALGLLRACQRLPFARLRELRVSPALLEEVERAMHHYLTYHLEQDIRTGTFLRRLRRARGPL